MAILIPNPRIRRLWKAAVQARKNSYSPYSKYAVGVAISGGKKLFTGCNVENASYGGTVCAERTALLKGVSEGQKAFETLFLVVDGKGADEVVPCALCLQTIAEFCGPDLDIWVGSPRKILARYRFAELLPHAFRREQLEAARR